MPDGQLAIVLDSVVQSAPSINEPSYEADQIQISGSFTESEAKDLALVLRYGSLPVELERQSVQTVSASLGDDSLRAGIIAGIVGLVLVALYMLLYYRALGLVVIVGLTVWGSLLYTIISFLGETQGLALTLAGVTGIIVSIGVTVDSYVVYFERLKDEVKAGRTLRTSTERAFKRAFRTILAADFSAFIGAAVLWWLTVGSVRGFAFFLGLSTVLDVVVAWAFTHPGRAAVPEPGLHRHAGLRGGPGLAAPPARAAPAERPVAVTEQDDEQATRDRPHGDEGRRRDARPTERTPTTPATGDARRRRRRPPPTGRRRGAGARPAAPGRPVGRARQSVKRSIWSRLYHGETNVDFVGRRRLWFTISLVAVVDQPGVVRLAGPQPRHRLRGRRRVGGAGRRRLGGRGPRRRRPVRPGRRHHPGARERRRPRASGSRPSRSAPRSPTRCRRAGRADGLDTSTRSTSTRSARRGARRSARRRCGP